MVFVNDLDKSIGWVSLSKYMNQISPKLPNSICVQTAYNALTLRSLWRFLQKFMRMNSAYLAVAQFI